MISRGHRFRDIKEYYTLDQIGLFSRVALSNKRADFRELLGMIRVAVHADKRGWESFVRRLEIQDRKMRARQPQKEVVMTPQKVKFIEALLRGDRNATRH